MGRTQVINEGPLAIWEILGNMGRPQAITGSLWPYGKDSGQIGSTQATNEGPEAIWEEPRAKVKIPGLH